MARGNQREQAREKNLAKLASQVSTKYVFATLIPVG
jgi:hypothetical protein